MYLLLFLVSPTCPLLRSNQSQALAPHGQALSITLPYAHFLVFHSYLTCLYLPFTQNIIREEPHNGLYQFPPELRFSTYTLHRLTLISHYFTLFRTISHYFTLFRIASHCHDPTISTCHNTPGDNPLPPDHTPSEPHRIYT